MTIKSLFDEITVPYRLTRDVLIEQSPSLVLPKMSHLTGKKLQPRIEFFSKHKFYSHLLEWIKVNDNATYTRIMAMIQGQNLYVTASIMDNISSAQCIDSENFKLFSFSRTKALSRKSMLLERDVKSGVELNEKEVMCLCESIVKKDDYDQQEGGLLINLHKLEIYSPFVRQTVQKLP